MIIGRSSAAFRGVQAHSFVNSFVVNGVAYSGFTPANHDQDPATNPDILAAWGTDVLDDGWVGELDYADLDIICHLGARNANGNIPP